jgi:phosphoribosylformimino-5-aminoimidazole carboxamide ribonucleotide (ProFAR) isomerase
MDQHFEWENYIPGADTMWKVAVSGWLKNQIKELVPVYTDTKKGFNMWICTDITKDGMLEGQDFWFI